MQATNDKIKRFTDLKAWQASRQLVKSAYQLTENFPRTEQFGLTSQMRRAAISVASNIAEGFRRTSMRDKLHFYVMAHGSLTELENQIILAEDLNFIEHKDFLLLEDLSLEADRLVSGLVKATKERL